MSYELLVNDRPAGQVATISGWRQLVEYVGGEGTDALSSLVRTGEADARQLRRAVRNALTRPDVPGPVRVILEELLTLVPQRAGRVGITCE